MIIQAAMIRRAQNAISVEYFHPPEEFSDDPLWLDNISHDAWAHYYEQQRSNRFVKAGLIDLERPQREGDGYFVCMFPSEMCEKAKPYADVECDWDEDIKEPDLQSGLNSLLSRHGDSFTDPMAKYEKMLSLFPRDHKVILDTRREHILRFMRNVTKAKRITREMRDDIDTSFQKSLELHPEIKDKLEAIKSDFTMDLLSRKVEADGTFSR